MMDKSPVRTDVYEKFLAGVDSAIRHAYQGAGFGDNERPAPEKELLLNGRIPAVLVPAVSTLLKQTVPALKAEVDQMSVYLTDYSWLGFRNDRRTEYYRRTREIDIVKKLPLRTFNLNGLPADTTNLGGQEDELVKETSLPAGQSRRRCVRCCEISGDVASPRSVLWFRLIVRMQLVRSCMCAGMWTVESGANALSPPEQQQQQSVVAGRENGTTTAVGASS
jgi:mediator of RNA polymerase II transcription subunit 16